MTMGSSDCCYDQIFEDYLTYSESEILDSDTDTFDFGKTVAKKPSIESFNSVSTITTKLIDSAIKANSIMSNQDINVDEISIPTRSPARLMGKKVELVTPNSPDASLLDSSSDEYHSYGSDRSSQASIFSNISDRERFDEAIKQYEHSKVDVMSEEPIDLDDSDYEEILELLDYINADEAKIVQQVDAVAASVGPKQANTLRMVVVNKV